MAGGLVLRHEGQVHDLGGLDDHEVGVLLLHAGLAVHKAIARPDKRKKVKGCPTILARSAVLTFKNKEYGSTSCSKPSLKELTMLGHAGGVTER